jgi:hypothetical protein
MEQDAPLKSNDVDDLLGAGRGQRTEGPGRRSREIEDRQVTENRELNDADRLEMFRQTLFNDVLPDLPNIPGYHVCWLSTTHQSDTIPRRLRLGYELVKASDIPGFEYASLKTGEYAGCIGINEMVAAKLPESLYQAFMQEAHHHAPAREAEMIGTTAESLREQAQREGGDIVEGDGMAELRRSAPARGVFTD